MIKLWDGWAIDSDAYNIILGKPITYERKDGRMATEMQNTTFHKTLPQALTAFYRLKVRESISKDDMTLSGAIRQACAIEERVRSLVTEPTFEEAAYVYETDSAD